MTKKQERENKVLDILKHRKKLSTEEVTELLSISASTSRRIFKDLENSGKIVRTYGGIHLISAKEPIYSFEDLESIHLTEKKQIALLACNLIQNDDIVYFDSGTTLFQLANALKLKLQKKELHRVRVVTNSFANLQVLNDVCEVILIGGEYRTHRKAFAGYAAERFVKNFNYRKAFLGADGFDVSEGFMATDANTAKLNEIVISRSEENIALLDSSKLGIRSFVSYGLVSSMNTIITDWNVHPDMESVCIKSGISILKASQN